MRYRRCWGQLAMAPPPPSIATTSQFDEPVDWLVKEHPRQSVFFGSFKCHYSVSCRSAPTASRPETGASARGIGFYRYARGAALNLTLKTHLCVELPPHPQPPTPLTGADPAVGENFCFSMLLLSFLLGLVAPLKLLREAPLVIFMSPHECSQQPEHLVHFLQSVCSTLQIWCLTPF